MRTLRPSRPCRSRVVSRVAACARPYHGSVAARTGRVAGRVSRCAASCVTAHPHALLCALSQPPRSCRALSRLYRGASCVVSQPCRTLCHDTRPPLRHDTKFVLRLTSISQASLLSRYKRLYRDTSPNSQAMLARASRPTRVSHPTPAARLAPSLSLLCALCHDTVYCIVT